MSAEWRIERMADVGVALQGMARRIGISMTALVEAGGVINGTLVAIGTGTSRNKDMSVGPLLRVLAATSYELVARSIDPDGLRIKPEGSVELLVRAADGGRIEVTVDNLDDVRLLLNTMAAANWMSVSGMVRQAGSTGTSLVGLARGTNLDSKGDLRLSNLLRVTAVARFELVVRPTHASRREARIALAAARRP